MEKEKNNPCICTGEDGKTLGAVREPPLLGDQGEKDLKPGVGQYGKDWWICPG